MRGKLQIQSLTAPSSGLIPACAGKTWTTKTPRTGGRAHPRVCGENVTAALNSSRVLGSSPRVRGKPWEEILTVLEAGLIPACAGKTFPGQIVNSHAWAHPRVCGENSPVSPQTTQGPGSSPRVRGKPEWRGETAAPVGLIPACAGKTTEAPRDPRDDRAHPRVCGENRGRRRDLFAAAGSSPRVRGKPRGAYPYPPC